MGAIREIKVIGRNYELSTVVDEEDYKTFRLWEYKLYRHIGRTTTYIRAYKNGKIIGIHRLIMGLENAPKTVCVDHIDHNGLNNYRSNLRITNNKGNQYNKRKALSAKTSSIYKGVCFDADKSKNPWVAYIRLSTGKQKHLGCYRTQEEAARSYNKAATGYYGNMAFLNLLPD